MRASLQERFWSHVQVSPTVGVCWLWKGCRDRSGYGRISVGSGDHKKEWLAHRLSYEYAKGSIPEGLTIDHLCFIPSCVNPLHLEAVTIEVNLTRLGANIMGCKQGHPYTPDNTWVRKSPGRVGHRECAQCNRDSKRRRLAQERISA